MAQSDVGGRVDATVAASMRTAAKWEIKVDGDRRRGVQDRGIGLWLLLSLRSDEVVHAGISYVRHQISGIGNGTVAGVASRMCGRFGRARHVARAVGKKNATESCMSSGKRSAVRLRLRTRRLWSAEVENRAGEHAWSWRVERKHRSRQEQSDRGRLYKKS